jgi:hypothetical protein
MAKLIITADQKTGLITLEGDVEMAFADGVEDTLGAPFYPSLMLYSTPEVQAVKTEVKASFKSLVAAMLVAFNIKRPLPVGLSTTVTLAKLTTLGTTGSLTFVDGILVSKVNPT